MPKPNISVVKFGGSVANGPLFLDWIQKLVDWSEKRVVCIVPGGGVFADSVRTLQTKINFDEVTAHELALMSMRQLGTVIRACSARKFEWTNLKNLKAATQMNLPFLWVPNDEEFDCSELPKDWSVTSDSIALWLAGNLNADELILLKSAPPPNLPFESWADEGYVDGYFKGLLRNVSCEVRAVSKLGEL